KLRRLIAGTKVLIPGAHHTIHIRNHGAEVVVAAATRGQLPHTGAHPTHRARRRPAMQVVAALPRPSPHRAAHALAQVAAEKVEALASAREVDHSRLLRMQLEP